MLHALAEMVGRFEREANESVGFLESLIDVRPVLGMADINMGHQALGDEVKLVPEAFHEHPAMALDLFQPFVHLPTQFLELPVDSFESAVDLPEFLIDLLESVIDLLEPVIDLLESVIDLLKPVINLLEPVINAFEALINPSESLVDPLFQGLESAIEILNEFLVHRAPAVGKSMPLWSPCQ
jgi:hypothetical protein